MLRYLFYLAVAYLLWVALSSIFGGMFKRRQESKQLPGEELAQCPTCKTYVPVSGLVRRKGRNFCSKECADSFEG